MSSPWSVTSGAFLMQTVYRVTSGKYEGYYGKGEFNSQLNLYYLSVQTSPISPIEYSGWFLAENIKEIEVAIPQKPENSKEFYDEVQITGCKKSCGSPWCRECYVQKGGSARLSNRLRRMDYRAVRQLILTIDLKKFGGDPQAAFETVREKKSISQFIRDLERFSGVVVLDWCWVLEWHGSGAPHWHLFVETDKFGAASRIGNETLLKHWRHGLVIESYINDQAHWDRFTDYFSKAGYFDPRDEGKNKDHQLALPEWAMNQTYRIRKTGAKIKRSKESGFDGDEAERCVEEENQEEKPDQVREKKPRTYSEILSECGKETVCEIVRGENNVVWTKLAIPYREFRKIAGEYLYKIGYRIQMKLDEFYLFLSFFLKEEMI
jgi:hypothetical protein